ncbi:haloacid dehalogenase [Cryphonectria parasitica EP155]|uniref:Haloacid dehalogenase n=1 Tax=Cryphonectria parasitica (strain ATCC 38755 / EP155) TaxID=660469 RepID=A0A9P4XTL2_CRYP1|nr:haloacid dehalogenase [Cryphonectria parasitica EP155]KAF3761094.1 haloacid dehalogenase [Cryphonectria parasitica EP155]
MTTSLEALKNIKALTFDTFGTVVDWRSSVEEGLKAALKTKIDSPLFHSLPPGLQQRAQELTDADWATFAQQWRNTYSAFTLGFRAGETPWKDIDTHHHDSLVELLARWELDGLYTPEEIRDLSLVWHRLRPWPDSAEGIHALGDDGLGLVTATLSNGNKSLLADLNTFGGLGFRVLISAEDFRAYKPDPKTYLGAAERLGVAPEEVAMVAAHLGDLEAARRLGLRTIYVERAREEAWAAGEETYRSAREWVDLWVGEREGGFVEVARRLGECGLKGGS